MIVLSGTIKNPRIDVPTYTKAPDARPHSITAAIPARDAIAEKAKLPVGTAEAIYMNMTESAAMTAEKVICFVRLFISKF